MDIDSSSDIDDYVPTKSFNGVKRSPVKSADVSMADGDGDQSIISLRRQISEISKRLKDLRSDDDIGVPRTDIVEDVLHDGSDLIMSNRSNRSRHISTVNDKRSSTVRGVPELSDIDADADVAPPISRTGTARNRNISKRSMISTVDDDNATAERLRSQLRKASKAVHQYKVERDQALFDRDTMRRQVDRLNKTVERQRAEAAEITTLRKRYAEMLVSFKRSEDLRKRQQRLITLLQQEKERSHAPPPKPSIKAQQATTRMRADYSTATSRSKQTPDLALPKAYVDFLTKNRRK